MIALIPQITPEEFKQYVADGVIQGGMIPKLENSFEALNAGVSEVVITLAISHQREQWNPYPKIIQKKNGNRL